MNEQHEHREMAVVEVPVGLLSNMVRDLSNQPTPPKLIRDMLEGIGNTRAAQQVDTIRKERTRIEGYRLEMLRRWEDDKAADARHIAKLTQTVEEQAASYLKLQAELKALKQSKPLWSRLTAWRKPKTEWIHWYGGKCPIEVQAVEVELVDGTHHTAEANELSWRCYNSTNDIVKYRLVDTKPHE